MAINATSQWRIRAGGNNINGGGYDPGISGAGTDYTDQDSPQLNLSDFATSGAGSTTLTSATGGFTSAMIGNCVRIASGTNFQAGYYFITAYTNTNTVTLDRTPSSGGAGSSGVGRLGGAFAGINALHNGGGAALPSITTPLAAGHTVFIRGSGSENPGSADYTYTTYYNFPSSNNTSGKIKFIGYNGRPRIDSAGLLFYQATYFCENLHLKATSASNGVYGFINGGWIYNCWFDQAGYDMTGVSCISCEDSYFFNTGSTSTGTLPAIDKNGLYGGNISRNFINGWKAKGINFTALATISFNVIANCKGDAIFGYNLNNTSYYYRVENNSTYGNTGSGLRFDGSGDSYALSISDNIFESNSAYGINFSAGTQALNDRNIREFNRRNFFYNNTSGPRNGISAGIFDVTLTSSAFTNAAGGNFSLNNNAGGGALVRAGAVYPFKGNAGTTYMDGGAIQVQAVGGGYRQVNIRGGADQ